MPPASLAPTKIGVECSEATIRGPTGGIRGDRGPMKRIRAPIKVPTGEHKFDDRAFVDSGGTLGPISVGGARREDERSPGALFTSKRTPLFSSKDFPETPFAARNFSFEHAHR